MMRVVLAAFLLAAFLLPAIAAAQKYSDAGGRLRVALVKQPFSPNGTSQGPSTMANGGIQDTLRRMNAMMRVEEASLTAEENTEYGGWKRLGTALGHFGDIVARNERDGYFTVGLLATCPLMPGLVSGLQRSGSTIEPLRIGVRLADPLEQSLLDESFIEQLSVDDLRRGGTRGALRADLSALSQGIRHRFRDDSVDRSGRPVDCGCQSHDHGRARGRSGS